MFPTEGKEDTMIFCVSFHSRCLSVAVSVMMLLLFCSVSAQAGDRPRLAQLYLDGPGTDVPEGQEFTVDVQLADIVDVYGIEFTLDFDASILEVLDDGGAAGVQIELGDCPAPDFVVTNSADNVAGTISYAVTQLMPTPPCDGGIVATVRFLALAEATTAVDFTESIVFNPDGTPIPHDATGVSIVVSGSPVDELSWGTIKALHR